MHELDISTNLDELLEACVFAADFDGIKGIDKIEAAIAHAENKNAGQSEKPHSKVIVVGPHGPDKQRRWFLDRAIELPSNTTLVLQNCYLYLESNSNDNLIRNRDMTSGNENIHIIGIGEPRLDGNASGQDRNVYGKKNESSYKYNGIFLCHVNHFSISNLAVGPTHGWGITPQKALHGYIANIHFMQDASTPNQDGITFGGGVSDVVITNISGETGDDSIGLNTHSTQDFVHPHFRGGDLHHIHISNLNLFSHTNTVRLLCGDDSRIYDITIDNVKDVSHHAQSLIRFGDSAIFGKNPNTEQECSNIRITNIAGGGKEAVINFASACSDVHISGVVVDQPWLRVIKQKPSLSMSNIRISGLNVNSLPIENADDSGEFISLQGTSSNVNIKGLTIEEVNT